MASSKTLIITALAAAAVAGTSALGTASAGASVAKPAAKAHDPNAASVHRSTQTPAQVAAYWTKARMAAAKSVTDAPVTPAKAGTPASTVKQTSTLGLRSAPGSLPRAGAASVPSSTPSAPSAAGKTAAGVNQSYVWYNHTSMPATTVGKLYFTEPSGGYQCTATVIGSGNHSMIWTAGHCVSDAAGHWYSNFSFVPNYHDGVRPYGTWYAKTWSSPTAYFNGGNRDYDMAAITLWPNNGVKVADVTGWQGYKFNAGYNWNVYEYGYPADTHPFRAGINAEQLRYCYGSTWRPGVWPFQPAQEAIHCDMGHGASGGPLLTDLQFSRGWGYLVGNVSYHPSDSSDEERSPYLGDGAVNVYNAMTNA